MLKNILKIDGVQQLDKTEQKRLQGGGSRCYQQGRLCCSTANPNGVFCELGRCGTWGCVWY